MDCALKSWKNTTVVSEIESTLLYQSLEADGANY